MRKMLVVDPAKRLSVNAAVNHPWIVGETKSTKELHDVTNKLRLFNSKRRLKVSSNNSRLMISKMADPLCI